MGSPQRLKLATYTMKNMKNVIIQSLRHSYSTATCASLSPYPPEWDSGLHNETAPVSIYLSGKESPCNVPEIHDPPGCIFGYFFGLFVKLCEIPVKYPALAIDWSGFFHGHRRALQPATGCQFPVGYPQRGSQHGRQWPSGSVLVL